MIRSNVKITKHRTYFAVTLHSRLCNRNVAINYGLIRTPFRFKTIFKLLHIEMQRTVFLKNFTVQ